AAIAAGCRRPHRCRGGDRRDLDVAQGAGDHGGARHARGTAQGGGGGMSTEAMRAHALPIDDSRGTLGMWLFIASEALLFVCLFFSYFYIGHRHPEWPEHPPKLMKAMIMLGILLLSSVVLHLGEQRLKQGAGAQGRALVAATVALGFIFVAVQISEYRERLIELN